VDRAPPLRDALPVMFRAPKTQQRRCRNFFHECGRRLTEQRFVISTDENDNARHPARRSIQRNRDGGDVVVDNCLVADGWADNTVAALPERIEQDLEPIDSQDTCCAVSMRPSSMSCIDFVHHRTSAGRR